LSGSDLNIEKQIKHGREAIRKLSAGNIRYYTCYHYGTRAPHYVAGVEGVRDVAARVEQPAVRVVRVPLASHIAHVLQPVDLLLHEHPIQGRFRVGPAQRARTGLHAGPAAR